MNTNQDIAIAQPAGFWIRVPAAFVDAMVLALPNVVLQSTLSQYESGNDWFRYNPVAFVIALLLTGVYAGAFYSRNGATLGKKLMGLQVVDNESGAYISFLRGFFREVIGKYVSAMPFLIGFIMAGFTRNKRALHDKIFDTRVIKISRGQAFRPPVEDGHDYPQ